MRRSRSRAEAVTDANTLMNSLARKTQP
jgi:hypothetical protein